MKTSLRGEVIERWKKSKQHPWNYETTEAECLKVNYDFKKINKNPTPRFRTEIKNKNKIYVKQWVLGCHFNWLNPRKPRKK